MSRKLIMPNPENCSIEELEVAANCGTSRRSQQRMMALKALLIGIPRDQVVKLFSVTDRTIL
jgi:hypothetical protein